MINIITDLEQLTKPAKPLEFLTPAGPDTAYGKEIIDKLKTVLNNSESLVALAAPQIGIDARVFCIKFNDTIKTFINPIITKKSGNVIGPETFGSMPGKEILISRPEEVTVVYYTDEFKYEDNKLLGAAARIFDQQAQLLDGILPDALGMVSDIAEDGSFTDLTEDELVQAQELYKSFIEAKTKAMESEISSNPELMKQYKALKVTEDIISGRIMVVEPEEEAAERNRLARITKTTKIIESKEKRVRQNAERKAFLNRVQKKRGKK